MSLTTGSKLILNAVLMLFIVAIIGYTGMAEMKRGNAVFESLWKDHAKSFIYLGKLQGAFHQVRVNLRNVIFANETEEVRQYAKSIADLNEEMAAAIINIEKTIINENEKNVINLIKEQYAKNKEVNETVLKLASENKDKEAEDLLMGQAERSAAGVKNFIIALTQVKTAEGEKFAVENQKESARITKQIYWTIAVALIILLSFTVLIMSGISRAIKGLVSECDALISAAAAEKFHVRGAVSKINFEFQGIIIGINKTLDKVVEKIFWYEQLLDSIPFPVSVTDMNARWTFINKSAEKLFSACRKDAIGKSCKCFNSSVCGTENCGMEKLKKGDGQTQFEHAGSTFQADTSYLVNSNGQNSGYIEVVQDITRRIRRADYLNTEVNRLANNLESLATRSVNFDFSVAEADQYTEMEHENFVRINLNLQKVKDAVEFLVSDIKMILGVAIEGALSTRADSSKHNGEFRVVISGVNETLDAVIKPVQETAKCLEKMANGDLDVAVTGNYNGDHAILKNALNATIDSINEILYRVSMTVDRVTHDAGQVSDASRSLSSSASEQASSIEEVSATMHEISAQSKQNAENAMQADKLAASARNEAEGCNLKMKQMQKAMSDINESAGNISKIIKTIDEIAFQTNLLALNAAVEAARAGKHGKGFSVVAEEVRSLAQRSARAAKETAEMIESSIKKTAAGTKIADDTAASLEQIVGGVVKVTGLIGEISAASKEQESGVNQISIGLSQIDQVTQQNTAISEEVASASEELSSQARELKSMLAKFQLKKQGSAATAYAVDRAAIVVSGAAPKFMKSSVR